MLEPNLKRTCKKNYARSEILYVPSTVVYFNQWIGDLQNICSSKSSFSETGTIAEWVMLVSDSHTHQLACIPPSSQHQFPTRKLPTSLFTLFTLYVVISCKHCHFLQLMFTSFSCFGIVSFSYLLSCWLYTHNKHYSHLPCVYLHTSYTRIVTVVGHTVSLHNRLELLYSSGLDMMEGISTKNNG